MIIHHQVDNDGHHLPHDFSTLGDLAAVDGTVPGGGAVQDLIAECVQAVEHHLHHTLGIHSAQCPAGRCFTSLE